MIVVARPAGWEKTPVGKLTLLCLSDARDEEIFNYIIVQNVSSEDELTSLVSIIEKERPNVARMMEERMKK